MKYTARAAGAESTGGSGRISDPPVRSGSAAAHLQPSTSAPTPPAPAPPAAEPLDAFSFRLPAATIIRLVHHWHRLLSWNVPLPARAAPDRSISARHLLDLGLAIYERLEQDPWPIKHLPSVATLVEWMEAGRELADLPPAERRKFERTIWQRRHTRRRKDE